MSAYKAILMTGDFGYGLNRVNFFVARDRDDKGRPVPNLAWTIMVSMYAVRDTVFTEWMIDPTKKRDMEIFFNEGGEVAVKKWNFKDVYCVGFEENFVQDLGIMETILLLSGQAVTNGNATLTYQWA
ncbi:type VI secretion system tube protein TssD [Spirosoma foliorum]|uniref:Phage tail protein n=1 Tax=Spirosoma foliorum TaxID=2710596 RepID=A0A7G5H048_9BACT|nr:type VI secretion system tube protein TssD [Spirosoma foliorum]QMW04490.1 hypothetical protein H3H32_05985 [Spirosoma foliorum]